MGAINPSQRRLFLVGSRFSFCLLFLFFYFFLLFLPSHPPPPSRPRPPPTDAFAFLFLLAVRNNGGRPSKQMKARNESRGSFFICFVFFWGFFLFDFVFRQHIIGFSLAACSAWWLTLKLLGYWVCPGFTGLYWVWTHLSEVFIHFNWFQRVGPSVTGFYWIFTKVCQVVLDFPGLYWVEMGWNGFDSVLPSFTGLCWVFIAYNAVLPGFP